MLPLVSEESKLDKMEAIHRLADQGGHRTGRVGAQHRRGDRGGGQEEVRHGHKACDKDTVKKGHTMKCPRDNCDYDTATQPAANRSQQMELQLLRAHAEVAQVRQEPSNVQQQVGPEQQARTQQQLQPQHGHVQQQQQTSVKKTSVKKTSVRKTSVRKTSVKKTSVKKTSVKKTSVKKHTSVGEGPKKDNTAGEGPKKPNCEGGVQETFHCGRGTN
jgi:hypothetical protein